MSQVYCMLYINIFLFKTCVLPCIQVRALTVFFEMRFTRLETLSLSSFLQWLYYPLQHGPETTRCPCQSHLSCHNFSSGFSTCK